MDPMFSAFAAKHPDAPLTEYGYYEDQVTSYDWATNTVLTPDIMRQYNAATKPAVLVMTGALDPFHEGHAEALKIASELLRGHGYQVVYTHVVPDNISYSRGKRPMGYGTDQERVESIRAHGYTADTACIQYDGCPNFTSILLYVSGLWGSHGLHPTVFNVVGGDNAGFSEVVKAYDPARFGSVIVDRAGTDSARLHDPGNNVFVYSAGREYPHFSSTLVRENSARYTSRRPVMFIKNDLSYHTGDARFSEELLTVLRDAFTSYGYHVETRDYPKAVEWFIRTTKNKYSSTENLEFISLDKHIPLGQTYNIHRVFNRGFTKIGYTHDGNKPIIHPNKKYVLVDDDTATGEGMNHVRAHVEKHSGTVIGEETVFNHAGVFDVVDASDFTTIPGTGLVLGDTLSGGGVRVPYLYPHIPLDRFASVPRNRVESFTGAIVEILKRYGVGVYSR